MLKIIGFVTGTALTAFVMLAFAGNSITCRPPLRDATIAPPTFTPIPPLAGAIALLLIYNVSHRSRSLRSHGGVFSAGMLFVYATCFSYAYISLDAGVGSIAIAWCRLTPLEDPLSAASMVICLRFVPSLWFCVSL